MDSVFHKQDSLLPMTEAESPPKAKKNIFGGASGGKNKLSDHKHKVIADKITLNIMRSTSAEGYDDDVRRSTTGTTVIDRGTERLRALGREEDAGDAQNLIQD